MLAIFSKIGRYFVNLTFKYGVWGLGVGTFFESLGVPSASITLELAAGLLIVSGKTTFLTALLIATTGLTLGSVTSYYIGYFGSKAIDQIRGEKQKSHQSRSRELLMKYGEISILFAQLFGPARTWISLPAGAMRLDIKRFILYTAIGGAIYCSIAIGLSLYVTKLIKKEITLLTRYLHFPIVVGIILGLAALIMFLIIARSRRVARSH